MAIITTSITPDLVVEPYDGADPAGPLPLREVRVVALQASIAATGAGDTSLISVKRSMPGNQSYVLTDLAVGLYPITAAATNNYDNVAPGYLSDSDDGTTRTWAEYIETVSAGAGWINPGGDGEVKIYGASCPIPKQQVRPSVSGQEPLLEWAVYNDTANDGAYLLDFFARFLVFDLQASRRAAANAALLTR